MSATPKNFDRDSLVNALSHWLRWRGHTLAHDAFSRNFKAESGAQSLFALRSAARDFGIRLDVLKGLDKVPLTMAGQPEFPAIAVFLDGSCQLVRGKTPTGQYVLSSLVAKGSLEVPDATVSVVPIQMARDGGSGQSVAQQFEPHVDDGMRMVEAQQIHGWLRVRLDRWRLGQTLFGNEKSPRHWIWNAVRAQWPLYLQGAVGAMLINVLAALAALYSMQIYDRVIPTNAQSTLMALTVGVVILYMFDLALRSLRGYIVDSASRRVDLRLSSDIFEQALGVRMEARPQQTGTFIAQLREHESVREFLMSGVLFLLSDLPFIGIFLLLIWTIGGSVVWVPVVAILLTVIVSLILQWPLAKLAHENNRESSMRQGLLIEAVEGAETLKTLNAEWRMQRRWHELSSLLAGTSLQSKNWSNANTNLSYTISQLAYAAMIVVGVYFIAKGDLTTGALVACSILLGRCLQPLNGLVGLIVRFHSVRSSTRTLDGLMSLPVDRPADKSFVDLVAFKGQLHAQNLHFSYVGNDTLAVDVSNLIIQPGEKVAILGRTGSGKSTLLRLLSSLYKPSAGRVRLDGLDLQHIEPTRLRESLGYLTQDVRLFAGTLKDNLLLGAGPVSDDEVISVIKDVGVDRMVSQHPMGLSMPIFEGGGGLSGGQRQAVGLARLMLCKPGVILLDEPTASMDQQSEAELIAKLQWVKNPDVTLVIVTHKPSMLAWANRLIIMERGQIIADGPKDAVLAKLSGGGITITPSKSAAGSVPPNAGRPGVVIGKVVAASQPTPAQTDDQLEPKP